MARARWSSASSESGAAAAVRRDSSMARWQQGILAAGARPAIPGAAGGVCVGLRCCRRRGGML